MTKVFGIGLNKTGTKTLGKCLKILGFNHKSYDCALLEKLYNGDKDAIIQYAEMFDSFEDWPWPLVYKELNNKYPNSKFILTLRKSPDIWYESLCKHSLRTGPTLARRFVYGFDMPQNTKKEHIVFYDNHNSEVVEYFREKPDNLLVVCWENGDGWEELCSFLNLSLPNVNFPHENSSK